LFSAPGALAAPPATAKVVALQVDAVSAPPTVGDETRRVFRDAVTRNMAEADVAASLRGYSVSPSLIQLRRYLEPDTRGPKLVCIVDLALHDENNGLIGSARGSVAATGATEREAVQAAVRSAFGRVGEAVRLAQASQEASAKAYARK
jgi:hypothetical protein